MSAGDAFFYFLPTNLCQQQSYKKHDQIEIKKKNEQFNDQDRLVFCSLTF